MLKYCAWCGGYQGYTPGDGHQIHPDYCEIDTSTICRGCLVKVLRNLPGRPSRRARLGSGR